MKCYMCGDEYTYYCNLNGLTKSTLVKEYEEGDECPTCGGILLEEGDCL